MAPRGTRKAKRQAKASGIGEDGLFRPIMGDDGCPKCYGHLISGRKCLCQYYVSCREYTFSNIGERKQDIHYQNFETVPLIDNMDWTSDDKALSSMVSTGQEYYVMPNGIRIAASDVNLPLIKVCVMMALEKPRVMRAFMMRLDPRIRSMQDIANVMHVSKQAIQKRIVTELGIGKKTIKEESLAKLGPDGGMVYHSLVRERKSLRLTAAELHLPMSRVRKIADQLKKMGFVFGQDAKRQEEVEADSSDAE